jgi:hypothetical protein
LQNTDYQYKIDGYKEIFVDRDLDKLRVFKHKGMNVRVALAMHYTDANQAAKGYQDFWYDHPKDILRRLLDSGPGAEGG